MSCTSAPRILRSRPAGIRYTRELLNKGALNVADGMPVAWAARMCGSSTERLAGPDSMGLVAAWGVERGLRHYLFGGTPATLQRLQRRLEERYPGILIVGAESPPFRPMSDDEVGEAARRMQDAGAQTVWVGLGAPKQDLMAHRLRVLHAAPVTLCVGAAFDFVAGTLQRAPRWMRRAGLEWVHRFAAVASAAMEAIPDRQRRIRRRRGPGRTPTHAVERPVVATREELVVLTETSALSLAAMTGDRVAVLHGPGADEPGPSGRDIDCFVDDLDPRWPLRISDGWRLCQWHQYDLRAWYWVLEQSGEFVALDTTDDPQGFCRDGIHTREFIEVLEDSPRQARAVYLTLKRARKGIVDPAEWRRIERSRRRTQPVRPGCSSASRVVTRIPAFAVRSGRRGANGCGPATREPTSPGAALRLSDTGALGGLARGSAVRGSALEPFRVVRSRRGP